MTKIVVLFLGAGKLVQLVKAFKEAAAVENVEIELLSIEKHSKVPISLFATVHQGPKFSDEVFPGFLLDFVREHGVNVIIPNMDSATVALSLVKPQLEAMGVKAVVSDHDLCEIMNDKIQADTWFAAHGIAKPGTGSDGPLPLMAKHHLGYGSRGLTKITTEKELQAFLQSHDTSEYLFQSFIPTGEFTVDAYVDSQGNMIDCLCRRRLEVEAGIVSVSETEKNEKVIELTAKILAVKGWFGPITLQFFDTPDPLVIEINPRFGGGVTHALACGLEMPRWIIREFLSRPIEYISTWTSGHYMARYRQDVYFEPNSTIPYIIQ